MRFGFVAALLVSGWGGALAAAACTHAGAESHACCPRTAKPEPPHCHGDGDAQPTETGHGEQHNDQHQAQVTGEPHATANHLDDARSPLATAQPADLCSHCLSRPMPQRASAETRGPGRARNEASSAAPRPLRQTLFYNVTLTRAVVPLEHAPPPTARRHVILGLFLI